MIRTGAAYHECGAPPPVPVGGNVINFIQNYHHLLLLEYRQKLQIENWNIEKHEGKNRSLYKFILLTGKKPLYLNVKCKFRNVWKFHNLSSTQKQEKKSVAVVWQYRNQIADYIQYSGQNLIFNGAGIEVTRFTFLASFNNQQEIGIRSQERFCTLGPGSDMTISNITTPRDNK